METRDQWDGINPECKGHVSLERCLTCSPDVAYENHRYEYCRCATCGETHQRMDFYGNPHAHFCSAPQIEGDPPRYGSGREDWAAISRARMQLWARC